MLRNVCRFKYFYLENPLVLKMTGFILRTKPPFRVEMLLYFSKWIEMEFGSDAAPFQIILPLEN